MTNHMNIILKLTFVNIILCINNVNCEYFSSIAELTKLFRNEELWLQRTEAFVKKEIENRDKLKSLLDENTALLAGVDFRNPIASFKALKHFGNVWVELGDIALDEDNENDYFEFIETDKKKQNLKTDDLFGAAQGIARLQDVYRLPAKQLAQGNIMNKVYTKNMTGNDCFILGISLYKKKDYRNALDWLSVAKQKFHETVDVKTANQEDKEVYMKHLHYLAQTAWQLGNKKLSLSLSMEMERYEPRSEEILDLLKDTEAALKEDQMLILSNIDGATEMYVPKNTGSQDDEDNIETDVNDTEDYEAESDIPQHTEQYESEDEGDVDDDSPDDDNLDDDNPDDDNPDDDDSAEDEEENPSNDSKLLNFKHFVDNSRKIDDLFTLTCSGDMEVPVAKRSKLFCRHIDNNIPYRYLAPFKLEELYDDPLILMYHDVISDFEMKLLKVNTTNQLERSGIDNHEISDLRVSKTAWIDSESSDDLVNLKWRMQHFSKLSLENAEPMQIVNYGIGGHYTKHYDFNDLPEDDEDDAGRVATALFFISKVDLGGGTGFPYLSLLVPPVQGSVLLWYNFHRSGDFDYRMLHGGCPVLKGSKWIATKWFHARGQEFRLPCEIHRDGAASKEHREYFDNINDHWEVHNKQLLLFR